MNRKSTFANDLMQSMADALSHAQGREVKGVVVHKVDVANVDAKAVRKRLNLTQDEMAAALGTSPSGYKKWEQGSRQPSGAARTLLHVMAKEPEAVMRALATD
jgi:putative transcriptional regulator